MGWWGGEPDTSCSGLFLLLETYQVTVYNLLPQNPLELPRNFLQFTAVFALIMPPKESQMSRGTVTKISPQKLQYKAICKSFIQEERRRTRKECDEKGVWGTGLNNNKKLIPI